MEPQTSLPLTQESMISSIRKEDRKKLEQSIYKIVQDHIATGNMEGIPVFFQEVYEQVREEIFLKKLDLKRKTKYMLEALALSYTPKTPEEKLHIYTRIIDGSAYYGKK